MDPRKTLSFRYHVHFDAHRCICALEPSYTKTCSGYDLTRHKSHLFRISAILNAVIVWIIPRIRGKAFPQTVKRQCYNTT